MTVQIPLPHEALETLEVPKLGHPADEDLEQHVVVAARLLTISALASRRLHRPLVAASVIAQVQRLAALDELFLDVAEAVIPPGVWDTVMAIHKTLAAPAIPRAYQGRDRRLCALVIFLTDSPCSDADLMRLLTGLASASRYESCQYDALLTDLAEAGMLADLAPQVIEALDGAGPDART